MSEISSGMVAATMLAFADAISLVACPTCKAGKNQMCKGKEVHEMRIVFSIATTVPNAAVKEFLDSGSTSFSDRFDAERNYLN